MSGAADTVVFFDVDNTLLDNDRVQADITAWLAGEFGEAARDRYWAIYRERFETLGYADYLGAAEAFRSEDVGDQRRLRLGAWLLDYPFAERAYAGSHTAIEAARRWGTVAILSDGDAVFQPRKIARSGLHEAFAGHVLIYIHKEQELAAVERAFPARRYVMVDDKIRILAAMKKQWGERLTTIFPRQGHYALDVADVAKYPAADFTIETIGELVNIALPA